MLEKDFTFKELQTINLSALLGADEQLLKAHQQAMENTWQCLKRVSRSSEPSVPVQIHVGKTWQCSDGVRHDDPEKHQG